jgi:hypothetical protein
MYFLSNRNDKHDTCITRQSSKGSGLLRQGQLSQGCFQAFPAGQFSSMLKGWLAGSDSF